MAQFVAVFEPINNTFETEFEGFTPVSEGGYDKGYANGFSEGEKEGFDKGKSEGLEQGKKLEYDVFWDNAQNYGNRESHSYAFAGAGWNDNNFKPKYNMRVTNAQYMFRYTAIEHLAEILASQKVIIDFSAITNTDRMFADGALVHIGECDFTNTKNVASTFANARSLQTIDKIIVNESNVFDTTFTNCAALDKVAFDGVIGKSINFQWSPLSKKSFENIIPHLSENVTGQTATFKKSAVIAAFGSTTSAEWLALVGSKSNWTISLV